MIEGTERPKSGILPSNVASPEVAIDIGERHAAVCAMMLRELRSWGTWQIGLGVVHLVGTQLFDAAWGILLIMVGLSSFWFRSRALFVVYATTLAWAALSNVTSGQTAWVGFCLLQLYFVYRVGRQFHVFAPAQTGHGVDRAVRAFPVAAGLLGPLALLGLLATFVVLAGTQGKAASPITDLVFGSMVNLGVLALALALGSLLCGYRLRSLSILGLVTSAIAVAIWAAVLVF